MYSGAMRAAYDCVNPAGRGWRWVDAAKARRESACHRCGTPFCAEAIRSWPPLEEGAKGKGKGRGGQGQVQGGGGAGAHVQGGNGGKRAGLKAVGLQGQHPLQGCGGKGGGAGKPTGAAAAPRQVSTSKVAKAEAMLARVLQAVEGDEQHP